MSSNTHQSGRTATRKIALFLLASIVCGPHAADGPLGWAAYDNIGQNGTYGGGHGTVVRVKSKADLAKYAAMTAPYLILVEGSFSGSGMVEVASDKTIVGVGSGATLDGFGFNVNGKKNIIIRNITIKNGVPDAIAMRTTHHVWIDHCDLSASNDGLLDYTIGSDLLTVSWTKFHDHDKVSLVNSGTQHAEDVERCRATYHHNMFTGNVQRNPRIGYGKGHVFNNYYSNICSYCVGYHTGASVLVENNYFDKVPNPLNQMYTSIATAGAYADAKSVGNIFNSCTGTMTGTGKSWDPSYWYDYSFALDSAKDVPTIVKDSVGPRYGLEYEYFPSPGNGAANVWTGTNALTWTNTENAVSWDVHFGTNSSSMAKTNVTKRTFDPGTLQPGTKYFWRVDALRSDKTVQGLLWHFRTAPAKASRPFPLDGDLHAPLRVVDSARANCIPLNLTWTPGFGGTKYKVYLGTNPTLTESDLKGQVNVPKYSAVGLKYGVKYYWKIVTILGDGSAVEGDTWSFASDVTLSKAGKTEAEKMVRNGRAFYEEQNGVYFAASGNAVTGGEAGPGSMSSVWDGPSSISNVTIAYYDESDGASSYAFYVNEKKIDSWTSSANDEKMHTRVIKNVTILKGDELRIQFVTNLNELARTDYMDVAVQSTVGVQEREEPKVAVREVELTIRSVSGEFLGTRKTLLDAAGEVSAKTFRSLGMSPGVYVYTIREQGVETAPRRFFVRW